MPDHVKLVVDDLDSGAVGPKAVPEGFPHVDDRMSEEPGPLGTEPPPEQGEQGV